MLKSISTHLFRDAVLGVPQLDLIAKAGFNQVEIFCTRTHLDYTNANHVREIAGWFSDSEVKLHSLHAPMYKDDVGGRSGPDAVIDITEPVKSKRLPMVDEIKRTLDIHRHVSGYPYHWRRWRR